MAKFFLPSLPVCPHCNTIYRYGEVRRLMFKKSETCYHCKKEFDISKKKLIVLVIEALIIYAAIDILLINLIGGITVLILFIINVVLVGIGILLRPYYIQFIEKKNR